MTKEKIEWILRRYQHLSQAIEEGESCKSIYVGHRRQTIAITADVKKVYEIIEGLRNVLPTGWKREMLDGILKGDSDVSLIWKLPCERSRYYLKKKELVDFIYQLCIAKRLITYEEILKQGIES